MRADLKEWMLKTSEELQGLGNKVLLWTNESPFSEFGAQTILTGNVLQGYDAIEIESYGYVTNSSNRQTTLPIIIHMNETGCMQSGAFGGSNYASGVFFFATRKVTPSSSGIVFDNAYGGYPNNGWAARNDMCVPYRIYGLKFGATGGGGGGGTSDYEDLENKPTINGVTLVEGLVTEDLNLGDTAHEEITKAEFDALTDEKKNDGTVYFITDGLSGNVFLDDNVPVGTIAPFGGTTDPSYWLICDGRAISRTDYASLFSVIGTVYGEGDGTTTFNIPDLRGRVAVGVGNSGAEGATMHSRGQTGGEEKHTLTVDEMPSHNHSTGYPSSNESSSGYAAGSLFSGRILVTGAGATGDQGGGQSHNNMQPYVVTNYIIKYDSTISRHQANIDFFYPVGSYYETSNASFDPNVTWEGTWISEGAVDDYIVEEGTDGIWTYRKWNSGVAECWGIHSVTLTHYATSGSFYGFTTHVDFPQNLFSERPVAVYNCLIDSAFSMAAANLGLTKDGMNLYALSNAGATQPTTWDIEAKGRWKELDINTKFKWHRTA